ncbi:MAG: PKD domain-containing protein, partial [Marinoscillum sp.]
MVTENSTVLAATRATSGIQRSTDGGVTWTGVLDEARGADIERVGTVLYASTGISGSGKLWKSIDDGVSWAEITPASGGERIEIGVHANHSQTVYAIAADGGSIAWFYRSDDGGETWTGLDVPKYIEQSCNPSSSNDFTRGQAWYDLIVAVHPADHQTVIIGGIDLYRSEDGGDSWDLISYWTGACDSYVHADQHNFQFRPGYNDHAIASNDGGVYFTANVTNPSEENGPDFQPRNRDYNVAQFYACAARNEAGSDWFLAGAQDNGSHLFNGIGVNSTREVTGGDGAFCFIDQNEGDIQITSYVYNSYYFTTDSWNSFVNIDANGGRFINPADYNSNTNTLYAAGNSNTLVRYVVDEEIESEELSVSIGNQVMSTITVSPYNDNVLFAGTGTGRLFKISGIGATPSASAIDNGAINGYISCVAVGESDNHLMAVISSYGSQSVYETKDGGASWAPKEGNLPDMPVRWALYNPNNYNEVLIATELGVWSTDDISAENPEWEPSNEGLANVRCDMLKYRDSDGLVILATHGRGLYTSDIFVQNPLAKFGVTSSVGYVDREIAFIDASLKATSYSWDFGDGTSSSEVAPSHAYANSGTYTVTLEINGDPTLTTTSEIVIQAKTTVDYELADGGDFESNTEHFTPVTIAGTGFELGSSSVTGKSGTVSGTNAWVTGLEEQTYVAYTEAYLYSPLFVFSLSGTYALEFYTKYAIEDEWEGFTLEYSTDFGNTWSKVGDYIDAVKWYNQRAISTAVVWEPGEAFFSGDTQGEFK